MKKRVLCFVTFLDLIKWNIFKLNKKRFNHFDLKSIFIHHVIDFRLFSEYSSLKFVFRKEHKNYLRGFQNLVVFRLFTDILMKIFTSSFMFNIICFYFIKIVLKKKLKINNLSRYLNHIYTTYKAEVNYEFLLEGDIVLPEEVKVIKIVPEEGEVLKFDSYDRYSGKDMHMQSWANPEIKFKDEIE